jgi:hypothetical protein
MDVHFTLPALTRAISNAEIEAGLDTLIEKSRQTLVSQAESFLKLGITPLRAHGFECPIEIVVRELTHSVRSFMTVRNSAPLTSAPSRWAPVMTA